MHGFVVLTKLNVAVRLADSRLEMFWVLLDSFLVQIKCCVKVHVFKLLLCLLEVGVDESD